MLLNQISVFLENRAGRLDEVLETLKQRGYLLGVISNKPDRETQIIMKVY